MMGRSKMPGFTSRVLSLLMTSAVLMLFVGLSVRSAYSPTVSFYLDLYPKGEYWVQFPRKMESECIYDSKKNVLACMGNYDYSQVTTTWKSTPNKILYVKVNCRVQDYFFVHRYVCFCINANVSEALGDTSFRECQLQEVKASTFRTLKHLQVLDLSGNYVSEVEPGALDGLNNLTYLSLSGNPFSHLPDGLLCNLAQIRFLHLSSTGLRSIPQLFSNCKTDGECSLEYLFMSKGMLSKIPEGSLSNMSRMTWLDLSGNQISTLSDKAFEGGTGLKVLNLSRNSLTYPLPDLCSTLPSLEVLSLQDCDFHAWDHTRFQACARLEDLDLSGNQILEVEGDFSVTAKLSKLNLSRNKIERIEPGFTLGNSSHLIHVDLSRNKLAEVYGSFLANAQSLVKLDFSHNALAEGNMNLTVLLQDLNNLKSLDLSYNNFSVLPSKLFPYLKNLQVLDISHNKITEIHPDSLSNLKGPTTVRLTGNHLKTIQNGTFSGLSSLKVLDLSMNEISEVDMASLPISLTEVYFSSNNLYDIPTAFRLKNFTSLSRLDLSRNKLTTLDRNCFVGFTALTVLDLCWNAIKVIDDYTFGQLGQLRELNLEGNQLVLSGSGFASPFRGAFNLKVLNLAFNRITNFPNLFDGLKGHVLKLKVLNMTGNPLGEIVQSQVEQLDMGLETLVLDDCNLSFVDAEAFFGLRKLDSVYLRRNKLSHFPPFYVNRSVQFDLSENPVICSCNMAWLKEDFWQEYGIQIVVALYYVNTCYNNVKGEVQSLQDVAKSDFLCKTYNHCPEGCQCFGSFEGAQPDVVICSGMRRVPRLTSEVATRVFLSGNDFSAEIPLFAIKPGFVYQTESLYLNSSMIHSLDEGFFTNQPLLTTLYLDHNFLDELKPNIFANLVLLEDLDLGHNLLSFLYPSTFKPLKALRVLDLRHNSFHFIHSGVTQLWSKTAPLRRIYLSDNPWHCSCSTVTFRNWLVSNFYIVPDWRNVVCKGISIIDHLPKKYECHRVLPKVYVNYTSKSLIIGLLLLTVFLVVTATFVFRIRKTLKALVFVKFGWSFRRAPWEKDKHFDAFILYNIYNRDGAAEKWVNQELVEKLERREKPYKVFLPDRDVNSEESIVDTSCQTIAESRRTIVVISESFATSQWCNRTFQMAYRHMLQNKKHKIIVVFHGKIKVNELDPVLKVFVMMGDYLNSNSRYFWERLLYELPDPPSSDEPVNENEAGVDETDIILENAVASDGTSYHNSSHV
ncbi:toll-like receptor Tollo [Liolophura sinensis]|uniref:toll-like receptor Tollo n=1 Tax=Liolophura sinensis TaxID=3198878 RepID=UPI0031592146